MMTDNERRTAILYGGMRALAEAQRILIDEIRSREVDINHKHNLGEILDGVPKEFQRAHITAMKHSLELIKSIELQK
jgi:hypothetical protein